MEQNLPTPKLPEKLRGADGVISVAEAYWTGVAHGLRIADQVCERFGLGRDVFAALAVEIERAETAAAS